MKLEDIGFYTLSTQRCKSASIDSPLYRAELIVTNKCNFKCPYCRSLKEDINRELTKDEALMILNSWISEGLKNVRFSGGEPTIYPYLEDLVIRAKKAGVEYIAISTNGSAKKEIYERLLKLGVNDFSISLDACCSSFGDKMAGDINGAWQQVIENIKYISLHTYVTVGVVVTEETYEQLPEVVNFAHSLNVKDIRIIPSAQWNHMLKVALEVQEEIINKHPILKYRINNIKNNISVRGITEKDSNKCGLVLDDVVSAGGKSFPCVIYMREHGNSICDATDSDWRKKREIWYKNHDSYKDSICQKNCLDVCVLYNNMFEHLRKENI